jgi:hypothetical protein
MNAPHSTQRGAALAIALLMLVIITLLGVGAVRATQMELRLSRNAESRMAAIQAADSMVGFVRTTTNLPVNGEDGFVTCARASEMDVALTADFTACGSNTIDVSTAVPLLAAHGYALVRREQPLFIEANVLRQPGQEVGTKNYDFARFTVIGGYDRSDDGLGAAEVVEGTLALHTKTSGVNYED